MRTIYEYINESLSQAKVDKYDAIVRMIGGSKITKETIETMLSKLNNNELKEMSIFLSDKDMSSFIAYKPNDDDFLKDDNKEKICKMLSEYLFKNISAN
jgi:hypothetical protein